MCAAAIKFLTANPPPIIDAAFDEACGVGQFTLLLFLLPPNAHTARVGFSATPEEILQRVRAFVQPRKADLGWPTLGKTLGLLKAEDGLKWAPALEVKMATEQVYLEEFGPKVAPTKAVKVRLGMKQLEVDVLLIPFGSVQRSLRSQRSR